MLTTPRKAIASVAMCLLAALPYSASSSPSTAMAGHAFGPGERLTFAISYLGVRAGTAVMEVRDGEPIGGRATWRLQTLAWTEGFVSKIFPIDDRVDSVIDAETLLPYRMVFRKHEGKKQSHIEVTFDHAVGTATTIKDGKTEVARIPAGTQHAFSALYFLRDRRSARIGDAMTLNVHHDARNYPLNARVEKVETVTGRWGVLRALEVHVIMPFRGIWMNEGSMRVWVSEDPEHVPLKVRAKVIIGSIVAELIDAPGVTTTREPAVAPPAS
jgi:hypothetical protein